jgi:rod shape-determining protein MreD
MMRLLKHAIWFVALVLFQIFVLDNTHFLGVFLPVVYIYALLRWPPSLPTAATVVLGFLLGLSVDVLSNTPGMHAASTTLIAFLRYPVLRLFVSKDDLGNKEVGESSLGISAYWKYTVLLVFVHHSALFMLESFSLTNGLLVLLKIPVCTLLTLLFIGAFERINRQKDARI